MSEPHGTSYLAALAVGTIATVLGACVVLLGFFDLAGRLAGLGALMLGAILTAPFTRLPGSVLPHWWQAILGGCMLALLGTAVELAVEPLGGFLVAIGSIAALVGAVLGPLPLGRRSGSA